MHPDSRKKLAERNTSNASSPRSKGYGSSIGKTIDASNTITVGGTGLYEISATGTLKTINGGKEGDEVVIVAPAGVVATIEDGTGNIHCTPGFILRGSDHDNFRAIKYGSIWMGSGKNPN